MSGLGFEHYSLARLEMLEKATVDELARLALIRSIPSEDVWQDDAVLSIEKSYQNNPSKRYTYVALKKCGMWYVTGTVRVHSGMSWEQFHSFIVFEAADVPTIHEVSGWRHVSG